MLFSEAINLTINTNIFTGLGVGNYQIYTGYDTPESSLILLFSELGLLGLIFYSLLFIYAVINIKNYTFKIIIITYLIAFIFQPFMFIRSIGNIFWFIVFYALFFKINKTQGKKCSIIK